MSNWFGGSLPAKKEGKAEGASSSTQDWSNFFPNLAVELEPLNPESYHNRAVIYEKQNKRDAAVKEYQTALRYNPQYEPSRQALVRLTGAAAVNGPKTEGEKVAAQKAEHAAEAARHGDYQAAMKELDEAEHAAPRYALVYQYRANVAFLMGDRKAAAAALRTALEIEPDNALYRNNLKRLEQSDSTASATPPAASKPQDRKGKKAHASDH
jgi:tetratricopeptide (TPR) repeat protein